MSEKKIAKEEEEVCQTYRDFSHVTPDTPTEEIDYDDSSSGATLPGGTRGTDSNFPAKLHHILSRQDLSDVITWLPHGRSWRLVDRQAFMNQIMPKYFSHSNYASFARQVNGWGFKRMSRKGTDYGSYYHQLFLRGMPHIAKRMRRPLKIGKKVSLDPSKEPNLEEISRKHPLPKLPPQKSVPDFMITKTKDSSSGTSANAQLQNLLSSGLLGNLFNKQNFVSNDCHKVNQSLRQSDLMPTAARLAPSPGSFSQDTLLKSIYQGLNPQGNSVQALLDQYTGTSPPQDNNNTLLQYKNILGCGRLDPLGSHNLSSPYNNQEDLQWALLQQRLQQTESNSSFDLRRSRKAHDAVSDPVVSRSYNYRSDLGLGYPTTTGYDISTPKSDHLISQYGYNQHGDDERSISSDLF